jgi:hypothetical protein
LFFLSVISPLHDGVSSNRGKFYCVKVAVANQTGVIWRTHAEVGLI